MKNRLFLTQAEALELIESTSGAELRPYKNPSGISCYRLLSNHRPIRNIQARVIEQLYNTDMLIKRDGYFYPIIKNPKQ